MGNIFEHLGEDFKQNRKFRFYFNFASRGKMYLCRGDHWTLALISQLQPFTVPIKIDTVKLIITTKYRKLSDTKTFVTQYN